MAEQSNLEDRVNEIKSRQEGRLQERAIIIVPYSELPDFPEMHPGILAIQQKIQLSFDVDQLGGYEANVTPHGHILKDINPADEVEAARQFRWYSRLLQVTKGKPMSVVLARRIRGVPYSQVPLIAGTEYSKKFAFDNATRIIELGDGAAKGSRKFYSPFTIAGLRRRFQDKKMRVEFEGLHDEWD